MVVTGADPAFCSGDDVREIMVGGAADARRRPVRVRFEPTPAAMAAIECGKPVIAAVNGSAVGWGMELALYADIRIASEKAVFAELFIKRGLVCDVGGFWKLPSIVGPAKAAELLMTGDVIDAKEAERIGLVSKVVAARGAAGAATALAGRIAANPPLARALYEGGPAPMRRTAIRARSAPGRSRSSTACSPPRTTRRASPASWRSARPCSSAARWSATTSSSSAAASAARRWRP